MVVEVYIKDVYQYLVKNEKATTKEITLALDADNKKVREKLYKLRNSGYISKNEVTNNWEML